MTKWRWEDGSGGAGHMQAVAGPGEYAKIQEASWDVAAYRQLLDHGSACPGCAVGMCDVARGLWRQVKRRPESP